MAYIILYTTKKLDKSNAKPVRVYVEDGEWGATATQLHGGRETYPDALTFPTKMVAQKFMAEFDGHPWYHPVDRRTIQYLPVEPNLVLTQDGWIQRRRGTKLAKYLTWLAVAPKDVVNGLRQI